MAIFAFGFLLRVAFDDAGAPLVWWGYGGLGLVGLVLTGVGITKALRGRDHGASEE